MSLTGVELGKPCAPSEINVQWAPESVLRNSPFPRAATPRVICTREQCRAASGDARDVLASQIRNGGSQLRPRCPAVGAAQHAGELVIQKVAACAAEPRE